MNKRQRRGNVITELWFDLKLALRALARSWRFTAAATTVMALGVGATTFAFIAINGVVLSPLPFPDADELVHIELVSPDQPDGFEIGVHDVHDLAAGQTSFQSLFAYYNGTINISDDDLPTRYDGVFVTVNAMEQIGVAPLLGRTFVSGEDRPGEALNVLIGWDLWRQRYNARSDIVGTAIRANGAPATIIGVMPQGYEWPRRSSIWVPMQMDLQALTRAEANTVEAFGRLREGVTLDQARAEFATRYAALQADVPGWNVGATTDLKPYRDEFVGEQTMAILSAMQVATLLVLLIACANVANLILTRTMGRGRELSVRAALGASRWRLVSVMLAESLIVSLLGGLVGIFIAHYGGLAVERYLIANDIGFPYWASFGADWRVATFAVTIAAAAGIAAGLMPALRAARKDVTSALKSGGGGGTSLSVGRFTRALITVEIALSCALLVGGSLTVRQVIGLQHAPIGGDVSGVMTGRIGLFDAQYPDETTRRQFWEQLESQVAQLPGVTTATVTTSIPTYGTGMEQYLPAGQERPNELRYPAARSVVVTPSYFDAFRIPLLAGRNFGAEDTADGVPVVLVNRTLADRTWPGESPLGKRLQLGGADSMQSPVTVVGVTADVYHQQGIDRPMEPAIYRPLAQADARFATIAARTDGDVMALGNPIREALRATDPDLPVYWLQPAQTWVEQSRAAPRLLGVIFGIFGLAAVVLATVGVYGVLAATVVQRTREFGVRRALGADDRGIVSMVLGQGLRQLVIALPIGLLLAYGLGQMLRGVLGSVSSTDPFSFLGVPTLLVLVVIAASFLPARRASRIQPMEALRHE